MARIYMFMFSSVSKFETFRDIGTAGPFWEGIVSNLSSCFDFSYFDESSPTRLLPPSAVRNAGAVLPQTKSLPQVLTDIRAIKGTDRTIWIAAIAKLNGCWSTWNTELYCPEPAFRDEVCTAESVLNRVSHSIKGALSRDCRLYVGSETCIHKGTFDNPTPLSMEEMMAVHEELHWITTKSPLTLIIPGTAYWVDIMGNVHNSLLAYANGENLCAVRPYEKKMWTGEELAAGAEYGVPKVGDEPYQILDWLTLRVGVQICQDSAAALPLQGAVRCDVHLILGNGTGHFVFQNRPGGLGVYVDAKGMGRVEDIYGTERVSTGQHAMALRFAGKPGA